MPIVSPPRRGRTWPTHAQCWESRGGSARHRFSGGWEGAGRLSSPLHHLHVGVSDPLESQRRDLSSCKPPGGSRPTKAAAAFALSERTKDLCRLTSRWERALTMSNKNPKTTTKTSKTPLPCTGTQQERCFLGFSPGQGKPSWEDVCWEKRGITAQSVYQPLGSGIAQRVNVGR